jgi:N-acetyl sugar amidotransferase
MNKNFTRGNIEKQIINLPTEVKYCKKCVISNQRPRVIFDEEGVCSACRNTDYKERVDWAEREEELRELLDKHRSSDGYWDVIVPSSGGKDSSFVAHQLKYKYGMNPLTVTWSPLKYTDIGLENFQSLCDAGFVNIKCTPNGKIHRKLARLAFEELGDAFHVFVLGQVYFPIHMALKFGIKLVFYGENGEVEYAGDPKLVDKPYISMIEDKAYLREYEKGTSFVNLLKYGLENKDYINSNDLNDADLIFYKAPKLEDLRRTGISNKYYYNHYHKWTPQENYYYSVEHTGFKANPVRTEGTYSKYASLDDMTDGFHYYMRYIKFGLGRCMEDAAHEIRDGHITREEGVALMNRYEGEFPKKYFKEFLEYLDITEDHFWEVVDSWRLPHLWEKVNGEWNLKRPIS